MRLLAGVMLAEFLKEEGIFPPPIHGAFTRTCSLPQGISHILLFFFLLTTAKLQWIWVNHRENSWLFVKPSLHLLSKPWLWQPAVQTNFFFFSSKMLQKLKHFQNNQCFSLHKNKVKRPVVFQVDYSIHQDCVCFSSTFVFLVFSI